MASSYVREQWGEEWIPARPFKLDEPSGVFFWVERADHEGHLDGPNPFFVSSETGRVVRLSDATVQRALLKYVERDPEFVRAVVGPSSSISGHEHAYREFVRDCLGVSAGLDPNRQ